MRQRIGRRLISIMLSVLMLVSLLPTAVFAEELPDQTTAGVTEQVGEGTGNTVKISNENEDSTGGEETKGESGKTKVGGNEYTTLEEAIAAAEPVNGVITYEIYGKAKVTSTDSWIQVLKAGLSNVTKVVFVGMTTDAEIIITNPTSVLADQKYDIDVSFENLTLSHPNGEWVNDLGHTTNYFACLLRNTDAAEHTVTYTNCTFPNGVCNNQYGKTVFDNCKFTNSVAGKYNLWNYGGNTEIRGSTFTGTRGIKAYNEGTLSVAPTVKVENTTFDGLTEKAAIVASKPVDISVANVGVTGNKGFITRDITGNDEVQLTVSGSGISGNFNITNATTADAAKDEFNITAGTFNGTVPKDYLAAGVKQDANGNIVENYVAKIGTVKYDTLDDAIKAVENGGTIVVNAGEYTLNGSLTYTGKAFTIKAADGMDVSFDMSKAVALHGAKITFEGVIFDYKTNGNYIGLQHTDTLVYNKCTINGMVFLYATNETFNSCTFEQTNKDAYNVWTYGAKNVEFNSCTFNCVGKSVLVYNEGTNTKTDLTVKDTKFIASAPVEGKAAIEIDTSLMKDGTTITVTGETTATGFAQGSNSKSTLWNDKKQTADTNKNTTVTVNGEEVFAPKIAEVGGVVYPSLEAAFAALSAKDHTLKLLNESVWDATTPVYWKAGDSEYTAAATLAAALTAAYKANAGDITIVCRPGADVGTMTHGHVADNITIYGNDAYISGGECDLEVDTYMFSRTTGKQDTTNGEYLTKDITINAYELDNLGVWGQRNTSHTINVNLTDCDGKAIEGKENVQRVYISNNSGVTSSVNNITLTGCNFLTAKTAVYSNANGAIVVDGCSFTGSKAPVNINHDGDGAVTVDVKNSTFTNCGDKGEWKNFAAPIRFVNSGSGTMKTTVDSCTFEGTVGKNGDILIGDGRAGKVSNDLSLTVKNTYGWVQAQKPGRYDGNKVDSGKRVETEVEKDVGLTTSVKSAFIKDTTGTRNDPYTLEQLSEMTRDEYIAAQKRLKGTMYVTVGNYEYDANGVLGNGVRNDTPGQVPDHSKLNSYAENGYLGEGNDDANGKNIVFVNGSITSNVYGYTSIDNIGTSLLLAVPAYTNVTFEGITFNNVMSFDYQLYTSPWSQLGELKFKNCVFEGIIVGAIAAQELTFDGCRFEDYENSKSENSSNPTWIRPAYGNWTKDDNEGQGTGFRSLTKITFTNNTVTSTRPVKFERIAQWEMATTVTATGNTFTINKVQSDTDTKNVGMYFGANAKFDLVVDNNKASGKTAGLYTAVYSAPNGTNYPGLPAGSTVKDANGNNIEKGVPALEWKSTKPLTLKTTEEVAQLTTTKGVVKFATLQEAIAEAKDGDTVKLLKDCSGNGIRIETKNFATKGLTVDFGGCTYTVGGVLVGSPGTGSNAFQLLEGGKVTFQNGTIAGVTEGTKPAEDTPDWHGAPAIVIQNYCDLTLKGMTVSGGDETVYTVSNNHGNVVIEDSTINAGKAKGYGYGPFAFDVCGYSTYDGVSVTVKGSSTINGDIEVSRSANNTKDVKLALESGTINGKLRIDSTIKNSTATTTVTKGSDVTVAAPVGYAWNAEGTLVAAVAQIGENGYVTLAAAIAAAEDGDTVQLLKDVTENVEIAATKKLTLDLNGFTLNGGTGTAKAALTNYGTITIKDSSTAKTGTIKRDDNGTVGETSYYVINNKGTMTIESGTVTNNSGYRKQNASGSMVGSSLICNGDDDALTPVLNIKGGKFKQENFIAIKNGLLGTLNVSGGEISSKHSAIQNWYKATITGGTINGQLWTDAYVWAGGKSIGETKIGGNAEFNGEIVMDITGSVAPTLAINGGNLNVTKWRITDAAANAGAKPAVSGGTFKAAVPEDYCAEGFIPTKNADGTYGVKAGKYVAEVKGTKYETLQEAVDAAKNTTVKMLADTKENVTISTRNLTLDLNGFTLNGGAEKGKPALKIDNTRVTVKDSSEDMSGTIMREDTAENSGVSSHYVIDIQGKNGFLLFQSGNVKNNSGNEAGKGASLVRVGNDSDKKAHSVLTIAGGTFTQDNFIVIKVDFGTLHLKGGTVNSKTSYAVENWLNANIKGVAVVNGAVSSWTYSSGSNSTLTISGGTINGDVTSVNYGNADGKKATVAITGGTINGELDTRSYDPKTNKLTSISDATKATIEVTAGTFAKDPTKYVVEDSTVNKNTDGTFGVEKAYLAKVGETSYYTMDEAFKAQTDSREPIVMLRDYTTGSSFSSGSINRTVDLDGHTWTCTGTDANSAAFEINHPNVTLTVKNGTVVSSQLVGLIPSAMGGTIKYDNSGLVFEGVTMTANAHSGIETNGNNTNDTVTLKDSTLNVPNGFGIYFPSSGTLTIDNSTINAKTMGVQVCAGSLIVSGESTKITVTGDAVPKTENDGAIQDGAAISIVNRFGYKGLGAVTISEGTFVAKSGNQAIKAYDWNGTTESAFTAGGKVTIAEENVLSSSADTGITPPEDKAWVRVSVDPELYVIRAVTDCEAKIGEEYYATLADAIAVAQNGATVVLVKDVDTPAVTYVINKDLTVDLNGRTVTGSGYDGVFQITGEGAKVLIKNGDVVAVEQKGSAGKYAMAIWACAADCEVTLEDLDVSQKITSVNDPQMDMIYTSAGTIIINSGSFASGTPAWTLNCKDAAYKDGTANIIVNGGTFKGFDPMNGETEGKGTSFVNAGVGVDHVDGKFTAKSGMTAQVVDADGKSVQAFDKLSDALTAAKAGQTVKLLNSVTGEKYVEVEANVTLDLNGHSITDARLLYVTGQIIDTAVTKGTVKADGYYINRDNEYTPVYDSEKDGYSLFKLSVKTWWYATEKKVQFALDRDMADFSAAVALMNANSNGRRVKAQVEFSWVDSAQNVKGKQAFELGETYMSQYLANASNLAPYVTIKGLETIEGTVSVQVSFVISKDELGNELFTLYGNKGTIKQ